MKGYLKLLLQLFLLLGSMAATDFLLGHPFVGAFAYFAIYFISISMRQLPNDDPFSALSSYRIYAKMRVFATAAIELGVMMLFCHTLLWQSTMQWWHRYVGLGLWLALMGLLGWLFIHYVKGRWKGLALAEFTLGALLWVLGDWGLIRSTSTIATLLWSIAWIYGIVLTGAGLLQFSDDFAAVGEITDSPLNSNDLSASNQHLQRRSSLLATGITMLVMAVWLWGKPWLQTGTAPRIVEVVMMQLPVVLMMIALYHAIRNPLDRHNHEKLMRFVESKTKNEQVRTNLQRLLGKKAPFGSRLICWLALPFFRHKILGRNNLQPDEYPSVFVCNHGFLYGPIVAALYLPTYFRPWIHDRMLREDMATKEIELSFPWAKKVFGRKGAQWLYRTFAHLVVRLLQSFRPIPVVRGNSKEGITTFDISLQALSEGDNLLIFPEKPKRLAANAEADLRNLYTGFAHIGKLYHDATGRELLFYPIFSDHRRRTFRIGQPVRYNPALPPRDAKRDVAESLQQRMEELMKQ